MSRFSTWQYRAVAVLVLCVGAGTVSAVQPYQEYRKLIESAQNLTALKDDLFGESVSLYNGKTEFAVTDVSLPGNNALPVQMRRRFSVEMDLVGAGSFNANIEGVGGWEVDVPYIVAMLPGANSWANDRCSVNMVPRGPITFRLNEVWQGNVVHVPEGGDRTMLGIWQNQPVPSDGIARKWTTSQRDAIDCIPMKSGLAGEGYRVKTTAGVSYFFDTAFSRYGGTLVKSGGLGDRSQIARMRMYLMASRVEDRSGNWVQYQYNGNGHPVRIWSSDGREISLSYNGSLLASVTAAGRTWTYAYGQVEGQNRLNHVALPDGSAWRYSYSSALKAFDDIAWDGNSRPDCLEQPPPRDGRLIMTIQHPSGATGEFSFSNGRQYRSGLHASECVRRISNSQYYYEVAMPYFFDVVSLYSKKIWGPGLSKTLQWQYGYGDGFEALWGGAGGPAIYPCTNCKQEKQVSVVNPDGTRTLYRYGSQYALNEGRLLGSSVVDATGKTLRTSTSVYMSSDEAKSQPFVPLYGIIYSGDEPSTAQVRPVVAEAIQQDGVNYQTSILSFDDLARPLRVNSSSPLGNRTDATQYADDRNRWILGATTKITNENTGVVVEQTAFDGLMRPAEVRSYGALKQILTYNADGTIATVADGRGNRTTLSGWKRGTPQQIQFADGATQSAVVDDNGWVASITDENGAATQYSYDAMGRVAAIDWPAGDSVAWARTTQQFAPINGDEYGIAAGHWRQVVATGNSRRSVFFDAFWRPLLTEEYDDSARSTTQRYQRFAYDEAGRQVFASHVGGSASLSTGTWTGYDALGRQTSVSVDGETGILTSLTSYLNGGGLKVVDPKGNATVTTFQAFGAPSTEAPVSITHPAGTFTEIGRDIFGKPRSIARRSQDSSTKIVRSYVYDGNQQLCKSIEPETGATVMGYDAAGNLAWSAAGLDLPSATACDSGAASVAARKVVRGYDARNRLSTLGFPDKNGNQSWIYTKDGRPATVTTVNDGGATQSINTFTYNKRGLLTAETSSDSTLGIQALGYAYDTNGALSALTYPSGRFVDYAPNAFGQPTKAGSFASSVTYYPNGGMKQFTYGNGIVHTMAQNQRQLPARVTDSKGALDSTYEYDANGNVARIVDNLDAKRTRTMAYDGLDRLIQATSPSFGGDGVYRYTYDAVDNLRSAKLAGVKDHVYWYDAKNRLTNVQNSGGATTLGLSYDVQGNLSNRSGVAYSFDFGNRLRTVASAERYRYDAHGRRILSTGAGENSNIRSLYGNDGVLRRQENAREGRNTEYIHLNGSLIAQAIQIVAPTTPVLTAPVFSSNGAYALQWTAVSYATRYELREQSGSGAWATAYTGADRSWNVSAKAEGAFGYAVRACQQNSCSGWSATASVVVQRAPTGKAVASVPATAFNGSYVVSWTEVAGAATYRLQERVGSGAWQSVQESAVRSRAVSGKAAGSYGYRIYGCNPAGCGPESAIASTTVIYPPAAATSITVPAQSLNGSYTISWGSVAGAARYSLEENVNGGAWKAVASVSSTSQGFSGKGTGNYGYRVRAGNDAGWGVYSASAVVSVIRPPASPVISAPAATASGTAVVSWSTVSMAINYMLEERINSGAWSLVQNDGSTQSNRSGLGYGVYGYRVKACNVSGCSGYSAVASINSTPPPATPKITHSLQTTWRLKRLRQQRCEVTWTASAGAASYQLQVPGGMKQYDGPATEVSSNVSSSAYCAPSHVVRACNASGCSAWSDPPYAQPIYDLGDLDEDGGGVPR
ncbi:TPA: RHS repeat protein [Stenotrophomonas maltophilia]|nr:RHS repeat protein [Stenotrophomonas maltophilia]